MHVSFEDFCDFLQMEEKMLQMQRGGLLKFATYLAKLTLNKYLGPHMQSMLELAKQRPKVQIKCMIGCMGRKTYQCNFRVLSSTLEHKRREIDGLWG